MRTSGSLARPLLSAATVFGQIAMLHRSGDRLRKRCLRTTIGGIARQIAAYDSATTLPPIAAAMPDFETWPSELRASCR